jgi:hypothetical protein
VTGIIKKAAYGISKYSNFRVRGRRRWMRGIPPQTYTFSATAQRLLLTDDNFFVSSAQVEAKKRTFAIPLALNCFFFLAQVSRSA